MKLLIKLSKPVYKLILSLAWLLMSVHLFGQKQRAVDSLQEQLKQFEQQDSLYAATCWFIARYYDDQNKFDSMQTWLDRGSERLPVNDTQLIHFHFAAFKSIAYYYNGLLQMDLYESLKVLEMARKLKDSILLTTGYNYVGLAYSNVAEYKKAIPYFYQGMPYARQPPYPVKYLVASKPHHLYGNLAEAYLKLEQYDSARVNASRSLQLATEIRSARGMAVAKNLLGIIYYKLEWYDSASLYQQQAYTEGMQSGERDVSLLACAGLASVRLAENNAQGALNYLKQGFDLKEKYPDINFYFTKQFLDDALNIYRILNLPDRQLECLEWINNNNARIHKLNDQQVVQMIHNGIQQETRANKLALEQAEQTGRLSNLRFLLALLAFVATGLILLFYYWYNTRRLKEIGLRQAVSRDLHDDINATLSSIKLFSELSIQEQKKQSDRAIGLTEKIHALSSDLMNRVGDVIYLLKQETTDSHALSERLFRMAQDILQSREIVVHSEIHPEAVRMLSQPMQVKNVLLIFKEALNNAAKYSGAKNCTIRFYLDKRAVVLEVEDDGVGIEAGSIHTGNGLQNIRARCEQMHGQFTILPGKPKGSCLRCRFSV